MTARRVLALTVVLSTALVAVAAAAPAPAGPVPGATYLGTAADGAQVKFTISSDGTLVTTYQLLNVNGNTCSFYANGDYGVWSGAPVEQNAFSYQYYSAILFRGSFTGAQSASGTFELHQDATGASAACDTGMVSWTATTSSAPRSTTNGGSAGSGPGGSTGVASGNGRRAYLTRIKLRRLSPTRLGGKVTSPSRGCQAGRKVFLWRGPRRVAATTTKSGGAYSFARTAGVKGRHVRVSAPARSLRGAVCAAGSSTFITG